MRRTLYDYCVETGRDCLLREFNSGKNAPDTPYTLSYGSRRKLWWTCDKGHEWLSAAYSRTAGAGCPVCAGKKVSAGENDLASTHPELAAQWDTERNAPLTPEQVTAGSCRRVWWLCEKGHGWSAGVKSRARGAGCPYCAGKLPAAGETDLASTHPELAAQWDGRRNAPLTPRELTAGSRRRVWWRCERGHEWQAAVLSRAYGTGCPVCAGRTVLESENDLASGFPELAAQWHPVKNGSLTPQSCTCSSNRKVWWQCPEGHAWQAPVASRTVHGTGCPYCAGRKVLAGFNDLASLEPKLAAQWHPTLNGALTPDQVTVGSGRKVWWKCAEGHVWQAVIHSRTGAKRCGCPVCSGRVKQPLHRYRYSAASAASVHDG